MKNIFFLIALVAIPLFSSQSLFAQLSIEPNPVSLDGVMADDFEGVGHSFIINNFDFGLNLTWRLSAVEITNGWDVAVCDINQCYLPSVTETDFYLGSGESGTMDVHVYPNGIDGSAIIKVEIYQSNDTTNITEGLYYFNTVVGVMEKFNQAIKIFPNPAQDFISIDNSENLVYGFELYNLSGKLVMQTPLNGNNNVSIQELAAGNYILKLIDSNANIVSTNLVIKQ